MASGGNGYVGRGAGLACRDWPGFAGLYLANLLLALAATAGFASQVAQVLNPSLEAQPLVHGFDLAVFLDLLSRPEVTPRALAPTSVLTALLFMGVTLFLTPGIVQGFLSAEHLRPGPFFEACGAWFWRFLRLLLLTLILLGMALGVLSALRGALLDWAAKSPNLRLYFYVGLAGLLVMWVVAAVLRLWFDLAQFHLVHSGERKVRRALPAGFRLLRQGFLRLFWIYLSITLAGWIGLAAGVWLWMKLPPARVGLAFLLGQAILAVWLATRFWQRAAEALWFRDHAPAVALAVTPSPAAEPAPAPPPDPAPAPLPSR